jgi:hypothetical protein
MSIPSSDPPVRSSGWATLGVVAKLVAMIVGSIVFAASGSTPAYSQAPQSKIAPDLQAVIAAAKVPKVSWAKNVDGKLHVKALVVSGSADPDLVELR